MFRTIYSSNILLHWKKNSNVDVWTQEIDYILITNFDALIIIYS